MPDIDEELNVEVVYDVKGFERVNRLTIGPLWGRSMSGPFSASQQTRFASVLPKMGTGFREIPLPSGRGCREAPG